MRTRCTEYLRNHWHVLVIVPLVVIVMTWPTFARIFDSEEFWIHSSNTYDGFQKFWDAWHFERVLAGKSAFYYTDAMFHPRGISLAFHGTSAPHAFLLFALQRLIPADDAYSLLYLLMLCFNAFCVYVLINHLFEDRWVALFGAVVVGAHGWFTDYMTAPDILLMGTLPLTLYFLHRSAMERRWLFAALAGICAGLTAFISLYILVFLLISVCIYALYLSAQLWKEPDFWLRALMMFAVCASISIFRLYPIFASNASINDAFSFHLVREDSADVLRFLINSRNPLTGDFLHALFNYTSERNFRLGYLGYINLVFIAIAILRAPRRRQLAPWLVSLLLFAFLCLGEHLTYNGQAHTGIALPERLLSYLLPSIFGQIGKLDYYQNGIVTPLAVLSCAGLATVLRTKTAKVRVAIVLLSILILAIEQYRPRAGYVVEQGKTAYINWLTTEDQASIKVINLPQGVRNSTYYLLAQALSGYPSAYGYANRNIQSATNHINGNLLLRRWRNHNSAVCLPGNSYESYINSLDKLLRDGFTHIVLHRWLPAKGELATSFANVPTAYQDNFVSVYRLADMSLNCETPSSLPVIDRLMQQPWVLPGDGSSIISFDPGKSIDSETLAYLGMLFSDWDSLLHVYQDDGEWMIQDASLSESDREQSAQNKRVIHFIYDESHGMPPLPDSIEFRDEFNLCRREAFQDGAVIELYFDQRFSCALVASDSLLRVKYDNGAVLENLLYEFDQDVFDVQILWRNLPDETHSVSVQLFDAAGDKVDGQDFVVGRRSIVHHQLNISALPPGDYVVKLIFYRYSTGQSVSGTISGDGARFDRALKFATIRKS